MAASPKSAQPRRPRRNIVRPNLNIDLLAKTTEQQQPYAPSGLVSAILNSQSTVEPFITLDLGTSSSKICLTTRDVNTTHHMLRQTEPTQILGYKQKPYISSDVGIRRDDSHQGATPYRLVFGSELEQGLECGDFNPEDVFRCLKNEIVETGGIDSPMEGIAEDVAQLQARNGKKLDQSPSPLDVRVQYPRDDQVHIRRIKEPTDLLTEVWRYPRELLLEKQQKDLGTSDEHLMRVFRKSRIAVPLPTMWGPATINRFLSMLKESGYPETTITVSEGKSAALFEILSPDCAISRDIEEMGDEALTKYSKTAIVLVDGGKGTLNITVLVPYQLGARVRVREIVKPIGSFSGSHRLNRLFLAEVKRIITWQRFVQQLDISEEAFEDFLDTRFERIKEQFRNQTASHEIRKDGLRLPEGQDFGEIKVVWNKLKVERYVWHRLIKCRANGPSDPWLSVFSGHMSPKSSHLSSSKSKQRGSGRSEERSSNTW
jgi:hypothetical protein